MSIARANTIGSISAGLEAYRAAGEIRRLSYARNLATL
jgi:hypothetical protein